MSDRRYDDEEARAVFDRASRGSEPPGGTSAVTARHGFTLAELEEIGAQAGLDPERIAEAAAYLDARAASVGTVRRTAGLPIGVGRAAHLGPRFDDDDWNRLVVDLRETFDARGEITVHGAFREWTNGNLQAVVEPAEDGYRLRLRTVKGSAYPSFAAGGALLAMAVVLAVLLVIGGEPRAELIIPAFLAAMGLGMAGSSAVRLPGWAEERARQMEDVATRALLRAGRPADGAQT